MLPRVLEPEVMDTPDDARDYDAMDHRAVNTAFVDDFLATGIGSGLILDLGTGTALIPIALCQRAPHIRVLAVDLASEMLRLCEENVRRAGLTNRIELQRIDVKHLPYVGGFFQGVMSNSIVHHIPDPSSLFGEILRVTEPEGEVFVRDLLRPPDQATLDRLVGQYAGDANDNQRKLFADSLHAALTLDEIRLLVMKAGGRPNSVQQTSDRHWTWSQKRYV